MTVANSGWLKSSIRQQLIWYKGKFLSRNCNFEPADNLILCSAPRGGSTWLAELLSQVPRTAVLFEPMYRRRSWPFKELNLVAYQPIPEHAEWPEAKAAFDAVFRGKVINDWTGHQSSFLSFLTAKRLVVKLCWAHAMLPWLTRTFKFNYRPVLLLRHPFAVAASQLKFGAWDRMDGGFRIPSCRFQEHFTKHEHFLSQLRGREESLVAYWCLANQVPLTHPGNNQRWTTVYYEHLLMNPEPEIQRIFRNWGLPVPRHILDRVRIPSAKTVEATFREEGLEEQLVKWRRVFDNRQLDKMMAVLDYFGYPGGYGMDAFPVQSATPVATPEPLTCSSA